MQVGVISDTHGHTHLTLDGLRLLETLGVSRIVHCGDIGTSEIPRLFRIPTDFVLGNVDQDEAALRDAIEIAGHNYWGRFARLVILGVRIAVLHGDDAAALQEAIHSREWDVVCCGHTHRRELRTVHQTMVLNPGAVYRARPHSVAVLELPQREVHFLDF